MLILTYSTATGWVVTIPGIGNGTLAAEKISGEKSGALQMC